MLHFVSFLLPPLIGYFVAAVLAVTPRTHALRVTVWRVVALFALRATVFVDVSLDESNSKSVNTLLAFSMLCIVTRTLDWASTKAPLSRSTKGSSSIIADALDLATTFRGHGWDWSRGVYIPPETRPPHRRGFIFHVILSFTFHALIGVVFHSAIRSFSPTEFGTLRGGSIFDDTLPFHLRYLRASVISSLAMVVLYATIQAVYDLCTITAVLVLGQDPALWPPAFDAPWRATSLTDLWGIRWHQFLRRIFLVQGGHPLSSVLGKPGLVVGAFLSSGFVHYVALLPLNNEAELWRMLVGFGMMAPGVLAEHAFRRITGKRVRGRAGWAWTAAWLLLWGNVIVDGFARGGVFGHFSVPERVVPGQAVIRRLVADFDAWLRAM